MIVMPASASGQCWGILAARSGRLGHLYSTGDFKGPWPWFPYALDNGCFKFWNPADNSFDEAAWKKSADAWRRHLFRAQSVEQKPLWAIVPDRPGDWDATEDKWAVYAPEVVAAGIPTAVAVQDGATPEAVRRLSPAPFVVCVGGSTDKKGSGGWKWDTAETWLREFPRVHVLRVNSRDKVDWLAARGCMSCDGTGWTRGARDRQFRELEEWAMMTPIPNLAPVWPYVARTNKDKTQETFA